MLLSNLFLLFSTAANSVFALPTEETLNTSKRLRDVSVFPNGTWIENIAVRSNGNLLVTLINQPQVWEVEPLSGNAKLVYTFPGASVSLGIAELEHDIFAVNVGNFSGPGHGVPGSWSLWTLDYNDCHSLAPITDKPTAKKVAVIPSAVFLNGLAALPTKPGVVLTGDSYLGQIFAVDISTGHSTIAIDILELKRNATTDIQLGVNGVQIHHGYLYFTNSLKSPLFARIPLAFNGSAVGTPEIIARTAQYPVELGMQADDFAIDASSEHAWVTTNPSNLVVKISIATGEQRIVAGATNASAVAGATGAAFGRRWFDKHTLYIVTDGGQVNPTSAGITGGKIVALDTRNL